MTLGQDGNIYFRQSSDEIWSYTPGSENPAQRIFGQSDEVSHLRIIYASDSDIYITEAACQYCDVSLYRYNQANGSLEKNPLGDLGNISFSEFTVYIHGDTAYYTQYNNATGRTDLWSHDIQNGNRQVTQDLSIDSLKVISNGKYLYLLTKG